jgi:hypothetical protein
MIAAIRRALQTRCPGLPSIFPEKVCPTDPEMVRIATAILQEIGGASPPTAYLCQDCRGNFQEIGGASPPAAYLCPSVARLVMVTKYFVFVQYGQEYLVH